MRAPRVGNPPDGWTKDTLVAYLSLYAVNPNPSFLLRFMMAATVFATCFILFTHFKKALRRALRRALRKCTRFRQLLHPFFPLPFPRVRFCVGLGLYVDSSCFLGFSPFLIFVLEQLNGSHQHSRWSGRGTLIFRHDAGRQIWSGCLSLHQAPRISCPLDIHSDNLSP